MSIDVYVFPTKDYDFEIAELEEKTRQILAMRLDEKKIPKKFISNDISSIRMIVDESYYVEMSRSLYVYKWKNEENQLYFLEGHAENIDDRSLTSIALKNEGVGYHFNLDSKMHRVANETFIMIAVAAALAKLTNGIVLLPDHSVENIPRGGYQWSEVVRFIDTN